MAAMGEVPETIEKPMRAPGETAKIPVKTLTPPSVREAERILREVAWDDRLRGYIDQPGPGATPEWISQLNHVHNLLRGMPDMFMVDFLELQQWVGQVLGDEEVAAGIGALLDRLPDGDENDICNRVWLETDADRQAEARIKANAQIEALAAARTQLREGVVRLLGERIAQCMAVLGISDPATEGLSADNRELTSSTTKRQTAGA